MNKDTKDDHKQKKKSFGKYQFKTSKVIGGKKINSYIYRNGHRLNAKSDTDKFFEDIMKYANVKPENINSEEQLNDIFDKLDKKGYKFHFTDDSKDAIKDKFISKGYKFKDETEKEQEKQEVKHLQREFKSKRERRIYHKEIVRREGRGRKLVHYEEIRILFKQFEDGRERKS